MAITNVVFDFDGTCTQIPVIYEAYLQRYLQELNNRKYTQNPITPKEWQHAQDEVKKHSPKAAWTLTVTPSAPASADPYILAHESAKFISRIQNGGVGADPPFEVHRDSNDANPAPWRPEARGIFEQLLKKNIGIYFISNSSSKKITKKLEELLEVSSLPGGIKVQSDASKFRICELAWDGTLPPKVFSKFESLPHTYPTDCGRPVYIRRGAYFEAICNVFGNDLGKFSSSVFCGDIWEMDLAMPYELGGNIHLIERAFPFDTYQFERDAVIASRGKISEDLSGLLAWL